MGNLVTNLIKMSGTREDMSTALQNIFGAEIAQTITQPRMVQDDYSAVPLDLSIFMPVPDADEETSLRWRTLHWGTRAHAEAAYVYMTARDVRIKFDTVNAAPDDWVIALAEAHPDLTFEGASYDEDTDYAIYFDSEQPGEIYLDETDDAAGVRRAKEVVHAPLERNLMIDDGQPDDDTPCDEFGPAGV